MKIIYIILSILPILSVVGCADDIEKMKLSEEEKQHVLSLQNPFGSDIVRLIPPGEKDPVLLGLRNCTVYRAEPKQGVVTEWIRITKLDGSYPLPSGCSKESINYDGEYVLVSFCKTPIGAGGGCAGGIAPHRSKNGKDWETYAEKGK